MLLLFDGMWWYPQLTESGKHRLSFVWDFNALSQLAKTCWEGFIFAVKIHEFLFKNIPLDESSLKNLHDFLEGNSMKVLTRYLRFLTTKVFHSLGAWIMGNGKLSRREYFQFFNKIKWWGSADHDQMPLELFVDKRSNSEETWPKTELVKSSNAAAQTGYETLYTHYCGSKGNNSGNISCGSHHLDQTAGFDTTNCLWCSLFLGFDQLSWLLQNKTLISYQKQVDFSPHTF